MATAFVQRVVEQLTKVLGEDFEDRKYVRRWVRGRRASSFCAERRGVHHATVWIPDEPGFRGLLPESERYVAARGRNSNLPKMLKPGHRVIKLKVWNERELARLTERLRSAPGH